MTPPVESPLSAADHQQEQQQDGIMYEYSCRSSFSSTYDDPTLRPNSKPSSANLGSDSNCCVSNKNNDKNANNMPSTTTASKCTTTWTGRIVQERHVGNMCREFQLALLMKHQNKTAVNVPASNCNNVLAANITNKTMATDAVVTILLHAERFPSTAIWMSVKGLRQLICPGVHVRVQVVSTKRKEIDTTTSSNDHVVVVVDDDDDGSSSCCCYAYAATDIQLLSVLPTAPYLARLLSFPLPILWQIFASRPIVQEESRQQQQQPAQNVLSFADQDNNNDSSNDGSVLVYNKQNNECGDEHDNDTFDTTQLFPPALLGTLTPCRPNDIRYAWQYCQTERAAGRAAVLWKSSVVTEMAQRLQHYNNTKNNSGHGQGRRTSLPPKTTRAMWQALERMERKWCYRGPTVDGMPMEYSFHVDTQTYSSPTTMTTTATPEIHNTAPAIATTAATRCTLDDNNDKEDKLIFHGIPADLADNLPNPNDTRRQTYIQQRKRPQVQAMLQLLKPLLEKVDAMNEHGNNDDVAIRNTMTHSAATTAHNEHDNCNHHDDNNSKKENKTSLHLVEVGGGRGYLGVAVAACWDHCHVTVLDTNKTSLLAAEAQAHAAGLVSSSNQHSPRMTFLLCSVQELLLRAQEQQQQRPIDVVFGLHCCGGLAEAAVELALQHQAAFCVSTCCFRSNPDLACLTRFAEDLVLESSSSHQDAAINSNDEMSPVHQKQQHQKDIQLVSRLATRVGGKGQHRAMRSYNAMRLVAAEHKVQQPFRCIDDGTNIGRSSCKHKIEAKSRRLRTWQETLAVETTVQNCVMMGVFVPTV